MRHPNDGQNNGIYMFPKGEVAILIFSLAHTAHFPLSDIFFYTDKNKPLPWPLSIMISNDTIRGASEIRPSLSTLLSNSLTHLVRGRSFFSLLLTSNKFHVDKCASNESVEISR